MFLLLVKLEPAVELQDDGGSRNEQVDDDKAALFSRIFSSQRHRNRFPRSWS